MVSQFSGVHWAQIALLIFQNSTNVTRRFAARDITDNVIRGTLKNQDNLPLPHHVKRIHRLTKYRGWLAVQLRLCSNQDHHIIHNSSIV